MEEGKKEGKNYYNLKVLELAQKSLSKTSQPKVIWIFWGTIGQQFPTWKISGLSFIFSWGLKFLVYNEDFYTTIGLNVNCLSCYTWSLTLLSSTSKMWSMTPFHGLPGMVLSWNCHSRVISSNSFHSQKCPGLKNNWYGHSTND